MHPLTHWGVIHGVAGKFWAEAMVPEEKPAIKAWQEPCHIGGPAVKARFGQ